MQLLRTVFFMMGIVSFVSCKKVTTPAVDCPPASTVGITTNSPVIVGWPLTLTTEDDFSFLYKWTGPNGWEIDYNYHASDAYIQGKLVTTMADAGIYKVQRRYSDGCVFDDSIEKCDYGMEINNIIHFVELKGAKNNKGLSQLLKSIQETEDIYSNHEKKVRLIVSKRKAPQFIDGKSTRQIGLLIGSPLDDESQNFIIKEKYFTEYIN